MDYIQNNWRGFYSPTEEPYTSLNRTLMNLPGGIPPAELLHLRRVMLPEPATNRMKLLSYLSIGFKPNKEEIVRVIRRSNPDQIKRAVRLMWEYSGIKADFRSPREVQQAVGMLFDFPGPYNGTVVSAAEHSIEWHRDSAHRMALQEQARLGTDTMAPPIPLPDVLGVKFLATVGDVIEEGHRMHHCIGGYSYNAAQGDCYLFHVDYKGEQASVEVSPEGKVVQAYGPCNHKNAACDYAERVLNKWGKDMKDKVPPRRERRYAEMPMAYYNPILDEEPF